MEAINKMRQEIQEAGFKVRNINSPYGKMVAVTREGWPRKIFESVEDAHRFYFGTTYE